MSHGRLEKIHQCVRQRRYDLRQHAWDELAENGLDLLDLECAILTGTISRAEMDDPRGARYVVLGVATDLKTPVGVVGRFVGTDRFLVITLYELI